jgi:hypothetical protein
MAHKFYNRTSIPQWYLRTAELGETVAKGPSLRLFNLTPSRTLYLVKPEPSPHTYVASWIFAELSRLSCALLRVRSQ